MTNYTDEQRAEIKKWAQALYQHMMGDPPFDDAKIKTCIDALKEWEEKTS